MKSIKSTYKILKSFKSDTDIQNIVQSIRGLKVQVDGIIRSSSTVQQNANNDNAI